MFGAVLGNLCGLLGITHGAAETGVVFLALGLDWQFLICYCGGSSFGQGDAATR